MTFQTSTDQEEAWAEQLKYHCARRIWFQRNEKTPSGKSTWADGFSKKFGEPYHEYAERMRKKKLE